MFLFDVKIDSAKISTIFQNDPPSCYDDEMTRNHHRKLENEELGKRDRWDAEIASLKLELEQKNQILQQLQKQVECQQDDNQELKRHYE